MNKTVIRPYELKQYEFCPRQWYYFRVTGRKPSHPAIKKGIAYHKAKATPVRYIQKTQDAIVVTSIVGGAICLFLLLLSLR